MAARNKSDETAAENPSPVNPSNPAEALKPFHDASAKFLQANFAAHEAAMKQRMQAWLEFQEEARKVGDEAQTAVMDATRKYMDKVGQPGTGTQEEQYSARAQSHLDYEKEIRQAYIDNRTKVTGIAQKAFGQSADDMMKQLANQRQDAYQAYLADLQRAWSSTTTVDPQTIAAIASNILMTVQGAC